MTATLVDPLSGLTEKQEKVLLDEYEKKERAAIQWESTPSRKSNLASTVREYIDSLDGIFTTFQLYADLGITDPKDKTNIRQILKRLKGTALESYGTQAGTWRVIQGGLQEMDLVNAQCEDVSLWLPFDLHNITSIMPGNIIVITGDPDAGKTAFLLRTLRENLDHWQCHYFNSEMGPFELRKRLDLFEDFPINHKNFHAYERSNCFEDVVKPGRNVLNVIDYLEVTDEFFMIGKYLNAIHRNLNGAVALIAIQKRDRNSDMPLGAQRALEKPRLAIALKAGTRSEPNTVKILKCKNRRTEHSMIGKSMPFKLIGGCKFKPDSSSWI